MTKLLKISANANEQSMGRAVAKVFVESYRAEHPTHEITELDLFDIYVPELDREMVNARLNIANGASVTEQNQQIQKALQASESLLQQFLEHDKYLFVTPLWNATFPARFKSYLDVLCVSGKTFTYTEDGYPKGLISGNRKAVHIHASGGYIKTISQADATLREVMNLIGIREIETLFIQGHGQRPDLAQDLKAAATQKAEQMARFF